MNGNNADEACVPTRMLECWEQPQRLIWIGILETCMIGVTKGKMRFLRCLFVYVRHILTWKYAFLTVVPDLGGPLPQQEASWRR